MAQQSIREASSDARQLQAGAQGAAMTTVTAAMGRLPGRGRRAVSETAASGFSIPPKPFPPGCSANSLSGKGKPSEDVGFSLEAGEADF